MSEYNKFLEERDKIDFLIQKGFQITAVTENLSGAFLELRNNNLENEKVEHLHITTADARKYFSSIMIKQNKGA